MSEKQRRNSKKNSRKREITYRTASFLSFFLSEFSWLFVFFTRLSSPSTPMFRQRKGSKISSSCFVFWWQLPIKGEMKITKVINIQRIVVQWRRYLYSNFVQSNTDDIISPDLTDKPTANSHVDPRNSILERNAKVTGSARRTYPPPRYDDAE